MDIVRAKLLLGTRLLIRSSIARRDRPGYLVHVILSLIKLPMVKFTATCKVPEELVIVDAEGSTMTFGSTSAATAWRLGAELRRQLQRHVGTQRQ